MLNQRFPAGRGPVRFGSPVDHEPAGGERCRRRSLGETSRVNQAREHEMKSSIGTAGEARRPRHAHNLCREDAPPLCCSRLMADRVALNARSAGVTCPAGRSIAPRRTPPPRLGTFGGARPATSRGHLLRRRPIPGSGVSRRAVASAEVWAWRRSRADSVSRSGEWASPVGSWQRKGEPEARVRPGDPAVHAAWEGIDE